MITHEKGKWVHCSEDGVTSAYDTPEEAMLAEFGPDDEEEEERQDYDEDQPRDEDGKFGEGGGGGGKKEKAEKKEKPLTSFPKREASPVTASTKPAPAHPTGSAVKDPSAMAEWAHGMMEHFASRGEHDVAKGYAAVKEKYARRAAKEEKKAARERSAKNPHKDSRVQRFDRSPLRPPETTQEGYLRVDGKIARTGIQVYRRADGTEIREYRPPASVFSPEYLKSLEGIPLTNQHPMGLLNSTNAKEHAIGSVTSVRKLDDKWIGARMTVWDDKAKAAIKAGRAQLSVGYTAEVVEEPGETPEGERYDAIQKDIVGNHLALCDDARAGKEACLRLDSEGNAIDDLQIRHTEQMALSSKQSMEKPMHKVKLDGGLEFETSDPNAQALVDKARMDSRAEGKEEARKEYQDKLDVADAKVKAAEEKADLASKSVDAKADAIAADMEVAKKYLGENYKMHGDRTAWKRAIVKQAFPKVDADKLTDAGLGQLYSDAPAILDAKQAEIPKLGEHNDSSPESARERMLKRIREQQVK